jgi:hypothetical protein
MILVHILALQVELFYLVIYSRLNLATPYRARVKYCDTQDVGYLCSASYNLAVYLTAFGTSSDCTSATAANNQHLEYCSPMITFDATKNYIRKDTKKGPSSMGGEGFHFSRLKIHIFARQQNPHLCTSVKSHSSQVGDHRALRDLEISFINSK